MTNPNPTNPTLKCGHTGPDWNGQGDCITCAREKILGTKQDSDINVVISKQELREKVRSLEDKLNNMNVNEIMDMVTVEYSDLEQVLSDTVNNAVASAEDNLDNYWNKELRSEVNKVLDELSGESTIYMESILDDEIAYEEEVRGIPLSAIEQVRKEWSK